MVNEIKSMDLDEKGIFKYNQRNGVISPTYTCFPNNLCQAWEILNKSENCWGNINKYHTEYKRIPDKLTYFMRFENMMREVYKFYYPTEYNKWITDNTRDKWLYSDNSYPPNEIFKIMCIGFNLFLNIYNGDEFKPHCYIKSIDIDGIINEIKNGKPVVCSFKLGTIPGHIMTVKGFDENNLTIYDTYGCSYLQNFETKNNGKILTFNQFKELCKPLNENYKYSICFY